jgi:anti-sigma regulatory factor (Ser/Thr protein kinase)
MKSLKIEARVENLDAVQGFICGELEAAGCSMQLQTKINIAAEEVFVNIAHYAYAPETGEVVIRVDVAERILVEFEDGGKPYNPLEKDDPDITLGADERQIGGLGVFMVKRIMDSTGYEYRDGKNILRLSKGLDV